MPLKMNRSAILSDSKNPVVIAIDGPAASGKSSVALALARNLGFGYINSGALYRAATWHILEEGVDPNDKEAVLASIQNARFEIGFLTHDERTTEFEIKIQDKAVSPTALRSKEVNNFVSIVSAIAQVREQLTNLMHEWVNDGSGHHLIGVVIEGRDIGSAVYPHTPYKFYVDASPEVRMQRRALQGDPPDQITTRDYIDSHRIASPLVIAEDAQIIDSSRLTIDGVVGEIIGRLKLKGLIVS